MAYDFIFAAWRGDLGGRDPETAYRRYVERGLAKPPCMNIVTADHVVRQKKPAIALVQARCQRELADDYGDEDARIDRQPARSPRTHLSRSRYRTGLHLSLG